MLPPDDDLLHLLVGHLATDKLFVLVLALLDELLRRLGRVLLNDLLIVEPVEHLVAPHLIHEVVGLLFEDLVVLQGNVRPPWINDI